MKILFVHNSYQIQGGEDVVVDAEISLLRSRGNEVKTYLRNNDEINTLGKLSVVTNLFWSTQTTKDIKSLIETFKPDVIHAHNTFPLISPSLYWVAQRYKVPIVQTLHNFRLMCLNGVYLRDAKVCESCLGKPALKGVILKCYRDSYKESAALASMQILHRTLGTYQKKVSKFIALNTFCKNKFIEAGISANKIEVKPNFGVYSAPKKHKVERDCFLFVGRLSQEKGIATLSQAFKGNPAFKLLVAGKGDQSELLKDLSNVNLLGLLNSDEVQSEMSKAIALLMPSLWYENLPVTLIEAFASGLPIIASRIGALAELVEHKKTGLLFEAGNPNDLAEKMHWALNNPKEMRVMGENARIEYEQKYTADYNYQLLIDIYNRAINEARL